MEQQVVIDNRQDLIDAIASAVAATRPKPVITEDELRWVRMAIQSEAQSIELRRAIIEKTLSSLVWVALVGLGLMLFGYMKTHLGIKE